MKNILGTPVSLVYDKQLKDGLLIVKVGTTEETIRVKDWRSVHYLFQYCDRSIDKKNYIKDIINPFLAHSKDDQIAQSKSHFGRRGAKERAFIFRVEDDGYLWHFMTTAWKPLTIEAVRGLLPTTAWEMTELPPTEKHGGVITYNNMFPDNVTAIVRIDAGTLDGMSAMNIKGTLMGELGEIMVDEKRRYRHTDVSKIGEGLLETIEAMNRIHELLPNLINIEFNTDMLGEYKGKLGKELNGKLTNGMTVYHALHILREAGKKSVAGTVLLNSIKATPTAATPVATPAVETPQIVITPVPE